MPRPKVHRQSIHCFFLVKLDKDCTSSITWKILSIKRTTIMCQQLRFTLQHFNYFLILFFLGLPCVVNAEIHSPWKMEGVNERIKKTRMGPIKLQFVDTYGSHINQQLPTNINLKKHAFQFGVGMGQSWALYDEKNFERYRAYMGEVFNLVALGFQWSWIEKKRGQFEKIEHIESNLKWAKARDINIKGMPLLWHNAVPRWMDANAEPERN